MVWCVDVCGVDVCGVDVCGVVCVVWMCGVGVPVLFSSFSQSKVMFTS